MNETLVLFSKAWPQLVAIIAVAGFIGWWLRGSGSAGAPAKGSKSQPSADKGSERVKNLEAALEKSKASHKSLKAELDSIHAASVSKKDFDARLAELEAAHQSLATESKRTAALEVELKKSQDAQRAMNARVNEADKAQKDRRFALENELSKVREQLALFHGRPDDSRELQAEIVRLRDSVATTTRFAGELRKRETTALEELEKLRAKLTGPGDVHAPAPPPKPAGDSDRVAAAKAEVLRLLEHNQRRKEASEEATEQAAE